MTIYSVLNAGYDKLASCVKRRVVHYLETELYGEACLYHSLGYSVITWPEGNQPSIEGHKMLLAQSEAAGMQGITNFQPNQ